jgi:hypothetical protein
MDDVTDQELGLAEDLGVFFGDEKASEREEIGLGLGTEASDEFLCLGFQFGRQRSIQRHENLQVAKGVAEEALIFAGRVQKCHQLFSCLHTLASKGSGIRCGRPSARYNLVTLPISEVLGSPIYA